MFLRRLSHVLLHLGYVALPFAARRTMTTVLKALHTEGKVTFHILPPGVLSAPIRAGHQELGALNLVTLHRVCSVLSGAVLAGHHPLAARVHHVRLQPVSRHLLAALVLAVDRLESAGEDSFMAVALPPEPGQGVTV